MDPLEIFLISGQQCQVNTHLESGLTEHRIELTIDAEGFTEIYTEELRHQILMREALVRHFGEFSALSPKERTLCVHLQSLPPSGVIGQGRVTIHGKILDELRKLITRPVYLGVIIGSLDDSSVTVTGDMEVTLPKENSDEQLLLTNCPSGLEGGAFCQQREYSIPDYVQRGTPFRIRVFASTDIEFWEGADEYQVMANKKLLSKAGNPNPDLDLVASDGTSAVPCHKIILSAQTTVLEKMALGEFPESATDRIVMEDMCEAGVNAFLDFLYTRITFAPNLNLDVALELFKVGHKYGLISLVWKMKRMLIGKDASLYKGSQGLQLFLLARTRAEWSDLKLKAVQVMKLKPKDVLECSEFQTVSADKSPAGIQVLNDLVFMLLTN